MNEPRVSVIMAAYNAAAQLRECLDSLLAQEGDIPFECVIVDDASTDATPEILADYAVRRPDVIRVFRNGENRERCYSRNRAIAEARADLVAVMDADDWAAPHRLRLQTEFMEAHPHVTVCGGGMECYETGAVWHPPLTHDDIKATLLLTAPFVHSTVMFRRGVVMPLTGGYNAEFPPTEDFELWARLARHRQVIFHNLPEPMLRYRSHPDMDRSAYKDRQATLALRVCQDLLADLGVPLDARGVRLFSLFRSFRADCTPEDLRDLSALLLRIHAACTSTGFAAGESVARLFSERWLRLALFLAKRRPLLALHALRMPAAALAPGKWPHFAALLGRKLSGRDEAFDM